MRRQRSTYDTGSCGVPGRRSADGSIGDVGANPQMTEQLTLTGFDRTKDAARKLVDAGGILLKNRTWLSVAADFARSRPATLAQNEPLDERNLSRLSALGRKIVAAVDGRSRAIAEGKLNREFALPGNNWASDSANDYLAAYRQLASLRTEDISVLRLRTQVFSGFNLLAMRKAKGLSSVSAIPARNWVRRRPPVKELLHWVTLTAGLPHARIFNPPQILGEVGWRIGKMLVNRDIVYCQERMTLLHASGVLDREPATILEIGAGYGALALALTRCLPRARYVICDLPESLLFSGLYLAAAGCDVSLYPEAATITLVPNYRFAEYAARLDSIDLAVNTLSMAEMSPCQIDGYAREIKRLLGSEGLFFEQNSTSGPNFLVNCKAILAGHFPQRRPITLPDAIVRCGKPELWSN